MTQPLKQAKLGRGLSALLGDYSGARNVVDSPVPTASDDPFMEDAAASSIAIDRIVPNPKQPRRTFIEAELEELADSIRAKGVIQPILVRPDPNQPEMFEIIAGERRWRAARRAGLAVIPAVVREMDDREMLEIAIIENVQRSDLNPVEEAEAYKALIDRFGRTQDSVAAQVGKSREHVSNTMRLLALPEDVREHVREGRLSAGHGRALLKTGDASGLAATVIAKGLSVRDTEALAKDAKAGGAVKALAKLVGEDKDVDTKALELDLQRALGLDVDIRHVNGKGGEVRIKYAQLEQLDEICRLLSRPRVAPAPTDDFNS
ncbi:MAG: chromosome partitioning protein ParB [Rhodobacterales bacterium 12-64-8]|nr:MAG: chromosome partitioning protein ParB [Rhodobacterales bacterium 12-64-8]OYX46237.1 MAG: chromosome partitioning protein ParB [Alphaproteobacteria bacterium 32-64-14]